MSLMSRGSTTANSVSVRRLRLKEDRQAIAGYFDSGALHPLIVTGATDDWPASGKWSFDFFAANHASQLGIAPLGFGVQPVSGKATFLGAFIAHLDSGYAAIPGVEIGTAGNPAGDDGAGWSFLWQAFQNNPDFFDDISPFPAAIPNLTAAMPRDVYDAVEQIHGRLLTTIYISRRGTVTPLHHDWGHTFGCLVQFQGRKKVVLFPPAPCEQTEQGGFDPDAPDYERYPEMRGQTAYAAVLEPKEMLIIPPDWLHYTRADDHSITLSHNFFNHANLTAYRRFLLDDLARSPDGARLRERVYALLDPDVPELKRAGGTH